MMQWFKNGAAHLYRVMWVLLVAGGAAGFMRFSGTDVVKQQFAVLCWKLVLLGVSIGMAHLARIFLFPYLDMSAGLAEKSTPGAVTFFAGMLFYAAVIWAVCSGL